MLNFERESRSLSRAHRAKGRGDFQQGRGDRGGRGPGRSPGGFCGRCSGFGLGVLGGKGGLPRTGPLWGSRNGGASAVLSPHWQPHSHRLMQFSLHLRGMSCRIPLRCTPSVPGLGQSTCAECRGPLQQSGCHSGVDEELATCDMWHALLSKEVHHAVLEQCGCRSQDLVPRATCALTASPVSGYGVGVPGGCNGRLGT